MSNRLFELSKKILENFIQNGWPQTVLFTGAQTVEKKELIFGAISETMWQGRKKDTPDESLFRSMLLKKEHPDFYHFGPVKIKIGDKKNPEEQSIRHLLEHFLVYSGKLSKSKFVYFEDAAGILNEAESALLKSLEEVAPNTVFVLSVDDPRSLKETIVSRCIQIPLEQRVDPQKTPHEPWEKFWYLSEWQNTRYFEIMKSANWPEFLKNEYDRLTFKENDFMVFENIGWIEHKKTFSSEDSDTQNSILRINFLPLYCALRDRLAGGKVPEIAPISLPVFPEDKIRALIQIMDVFFARLNVRYFGTRSPNLNVLFFSFLSRFMKVWVIDTSGQSQ